ncbi:hypothetical protein EXS73_01820 [Candidatus Pacearchaeota archaeon]|nr:hypothetical protein [Candidatus Pacearchaeota archaeon]
MDILFDRSALSSTSSSFSALLACEEARASFYASCQATQRHCSTVRVGITREGDSFVFRFQYGVVEKGVFVQDGTDEVRSASYFPPLPSSLVAHLR